MRRAMYTGMGIVATLTCAAGAADVYLLSSGDPTTDNAAVTALTSRGHTVTIGVQYPDFDGTASLAGIDTVYLQCNANWVSGLMPTAGQQQLVDWVNAGGRLVTSEWVVYYAYPSGGKFEALGPILPAVPSFSFASFTTATYMQATPDPVVNAGLPPSFQFPLTSYTGTETFTVAKSGATSYYTTSNSPGSLGLSGWAVGAGSVFSFQSTCGPSQVGDANFGRLFSNVMGATGAPACYANCDGSTATPVLTGNDFACFLNSFVAGASYANCDGSTVSPVLTGNDFVCFLQQFASGCR